MDAKTYEKKLSHLFDLAKKKKLKVTFPHGIICNYKKDKLDSCQMFLEVLPSKLEGVHRIDEGNYLCFQEPRETHSDPKSVYPPKFFEKDESKIIISCMSPSTYKYDKVVLEFQGSLEIRN